MGRIHPGADKARDIVDICEQPARCARGIDMRGDALSLQPMAHGHLRAKRRGPVKAGFPGTHRLEHRLGHEIAKRLACDILDEDLEDVVADIGIGKARARLTDHCEIAAHAVAQGGYVAIRWVARGEIADAQPRGAAEHLPDGHRRGALGRRP